MFVFKIVVSVSLTYENAFSERGHFQANRKAILQVLLKKDTRELLNSPLFERSHVFVWQSVKILSVFNTLTLEQIFWKMKNFFKKLEYLFLVESTKIESATNFHTKLPWSVQVTYHKQRGFTSNYFHFSEILFQYKNLL